MHDTHPPPNSAAGLSRREALRWSAATAAALAALGPGSLAARSAPETTPTERPPLRPRAKAVIELWMSGGPTHIDTFDPKPKAGADFSGPLSNAIATKVDGIQIGELLPLLAQQADKFSIIRSLAHGVFGHETASYIVQTGRAPGEDRLVYPAFGAVVSTFKGYDAGYEGMIPPYVVLTQPAGRFAVEGFLGLKAKPFVTGGDPRQRRFAVEGIVAEGISDERQVSRRDLLRDLDSLGQVLGDNAAFRKFEEAEAKAYDLILGDAGKVFDLAQEKDEVRARYGRTTFGQSCLAARRLVEQGVPYVQVHFGGWDTHKRHFESMRQKLPDLDRGMSALLEDLHQRGLLDQTIVWWCGEFGRTPRVAWEEPWNGGRHHYGDCFSAVVAGGGFQGGRVLGQSNEFASHPIERPVKPRDLLATMYTLLGIDPEGPLPNPRGLDVKVLPAGEQASGKGLLRELL